MMSCEYCSKQFIETLTGLTEKTLHEILHGPDLVNE
jgi:hypothetical protein